MLNFTGFEAWRDSVSFKPDYLPTFAGISGGRTSAVIAACSDPRITLLFENTGREKSATYDYLEELDIALGRRIIWLEYRKPLVYGDEPKHARFEVVSYKTANRTGQPFIDFMETLAEYRAIHKGLSPTSPWKKARICTAQMKHKTGERYIASLGIKEFMMFVGLRADEPDRVSDLMRQETNKISFRCPLFDLGIEKAQVLKFWAQQPFDLKLEAYQGNCDGCWLKDQASLSRIMNEIPDPEFWYAMEEKYPRFGGAYRRSYRFLANEFDVRKAIEQKLIANKPTDEFISKFQTKRRYLAVLKEEKDRIQYGPENISCACESSFNLED